MSRKLAGRIPWVSGTVGAMLLSLAWNPVDVRGEPCPMWVNRTTPYTARHAHAAAYDGKRGVTVVFGGTTETGEYGGENAENVFKKPRFGR